MQHHLIERQTTKILNKTTKSKNTIDIEQEIALAISHFVFPPWGDIFGGKSAIFGNQRQRKRREGLMCELYRVSLPPRRA